MLYFNFDEQILKEKFDFDEFWILIFSPEVDPTFFRIRNRVRIWIRNPVRGGWLVAK